MKAKKVLLIIPELSLGGAQRSISKLSIELSKHHRVWLVVFNANDTAAYEHGGELINLGVQTGPRIFNKLKAFFQRVVRLRKLKQKLAIVSS